MKKHLFIRKNFNHLVIVIVIKFFQFLLMLLCRCFKKIMNEDVPSVKECSNMSCSSEDYDESSKDEAPTKDICDKFNIFNGKFFDMESTPSTSQSSQGGSQVIARCLLCTKTPTVIKGARGVSSNFIKHLKRLHPKEHQMYCDAKKARLEGKTSNKSNQFADDVLDFIIDAALPLSVVENAFFKKLFKNTPGKVPTRKTITGLSEHNFIEMQKSIIKKLKKVPYVCTTADVWSCKTRSFFGYTCHWLNEKQQRESAALSCKRFRGAHTYDKIAEFMCSINSAFEIEDKLIATITDNGTNFCKAFREFGIETNDFDEDITFEELDDGALRLRKLPKHIRCASHTINLIMGNDFTKILKKDPAMYQKHTKVISKCNKLWLKSGRSKSSEVIKEELGILLSYPVVTRWNSTYDAIKKILSKEEHLSSLCTKLKIPSFTAEDILYLKDYVSGMQPFAEALDFLQGERGVFYGCLIPTLVTIKTKLDRVINNGNDHFLKQQLILLQSRFLERFVKYFSLSSEINDAIVAAVLHPEVKLQWFAPIKDLTNRNMKEVKQIVMDYIAENRAEGFNDFNASEAATQQPTSSFYDFGAEENSFEPSTGVLSIEREVNMYLSDPFFNSLKKLRELPLLESAFKKANTPLTSSAPVERLFSFAGIVNSPRRHALSDEHFEMLTVMKANSHFLK